MEKQEKRLSHKTGLPPGNLIHVGKKKQHQVKVTVVVFNEQEYKITQLENLDNLPKPVSGSVVWLNIDGLDVRTVEQIGAFYHMHPLLLEDLLNTQNRPKLDTYDKFMYLVFKALDFNQDTSRIENDQVSVFWDENIVITFQEQTKNLFNILHERLSQKKGQIRKNGCYYLVLAIMDVIIDHYFIVVEEMEEKINALQQRAYKKPTKELSREIFHFRQRLFNFRRSVLPLRVIMDQLRKRESPEIAKKHAPYSRDIVDHIERVLEEIEELKYTLDNAMETSLSITGQKTNDVMRFLTVITALFLPAGLLTGVYGMNFVWMPELDFKMGYPISILVMLASGGLMLYYFRRRDWL